ncbi:hypothetical protein [Neiella marina]|uniref:hypothetical protein n=1 Tax=Neiella marina TaxID=508461 RepID=UPI000B3CF305|nr:hypothetical protein [Neiella marina]
MIEILKDPTLQSFVFSPLMGVAFAAIFTGLTAAPTDNSPKSVVLTQRIYVEHREVHRKSTSSTKEDGREVLGMVALLMLAVWQYVVNINLIHHYISLGLTCCLCFTFTAILISAIKGHVTDSEWFYKLVFPSIALMMCFPLLIKARGAVSQDLINLATNSTFIEFFSDHLTRYGQVLMISQVIGLCMIIVLALISTFAALHYVALMNQRVLGRFQGFWLWVANITDKSAGNGARILILMFMAFAYLLVAGHVANWTS